MERGAAEAVSRVREIFASVVAEGFRTEVVQGASDEEIDHLASTQGVAAVPASLREVLRLLGREPSVWFSGSIFGVPVDAETKQEALDCLDEADEHGMQDPGNLLAVVDAASSAYVVVDGVDLERPDPPMWVLTESGDVQKRWGSVTEWFAHVADGVLECKAMLASRRAAGITDPVRDAYFAWS